MKIELEVPKEVSRVTTALKKAGFSAYIVGGSVRDLIMNREPKDWDITTSATPEDIIGLFPKTVYENRFGTVMVIDEEGTDPVLKNIEVTPYRLESDYSDNRHPDEVKFSDNIEDDLARRDFTINALAYDPDTNELIDLYGGISDIKDKVVSTVGEADKRFTEDGLRLMRAIRLAAELGFRCNKFTLDSILKNANLLKNISQERIRDEFTKIILSDNAMLGLEMLKNSGLLPFILPELIPAIGTEQGRSHIYDVWEHSLRALQHAVDKKYPLHLRLSALFHDIGKPATRRFDPKANLWTFYGHEVVGARIVAKIMANLKYSKKISEDVERLVRYHMFFMDTEQLTLSAVRRVVAKVGEENIWDLTKLRMSDRIGMGRPKEDPYRLRKYESMIEEALRSPTSVTMLKINGADLINELKLKPSPKIGHILHALLEEVLEDPQKNTKEYLLAKAGELSKLDENSLVALSEKGKEKKGEVEEEKLAEIRKKHKVR
ncbi:MAG: HD domain-containing protein [Patescibacteria group bacterium]